MDKSPRSGNTETTEGTHSKLHRVPDQRASARRVEVGEQDEAREGRRVAVFVARVRHGTLEPRVAGEEGRDTFERLVEADEPKRAFDGRDDEARGRPAWRLERHVRLVDKVLVLGRAESADGFRQGHEEQAIALKQAEEAFMRKSFRIDGDTVQEQLLLQVRLGAERAADGGL